MRDSTIRKQIAQLEGKLNAAKLTDSERAAIEARHASKTYATRTELPGRELNGWRYKDTHTPTAFELSKAKLGKLEGKVAKLQAQLAALKGH